MVGSAQATQHTSGFGAGLDYQATPSFLFGVAGGGGQSSYGVDERATSREVDAYHGAVYAAWRNRGYYATGIVSYDEFTNTESRFAGIPGVVLPAANFIGRPYVIPGFSEKPRGAWDSHAYSGYGEAGYQARFGWLSATPFAGLEFSALSSNGFTETNQIVLSSPASASSSISR